MAKVNFPACLKVTLSHEGGWSDHPSDPGGATMKGITIGRFRQYKPSATKTDLRNISDALVEQIYRDDYWRPVRGDDLPYGVDLATFDYGVNSGPSRAARYLQWVVGTKQDGIVGPETLKSVTLADGKSVIQRLCARRLSFVQGLSTFKVFGRGWSRRIADVEAKAVAMWLARGGALTDADRSALKDEAAKAKAEASAQNSVATGGGAVAGGSAVVADLNAATITFIALLVIGAIILVVQARQSKDRSAAYAREAMK